MIVGETYTEHEAREQTSFACRAGYELWRMLREAGFPLSPVDDHYPGSIKMKVLWKNSEIGTTSAFKLQAKISSLCLTKKEAKEQGVEIRDDLPQLQLHSYLRSEYYPEIERLHTEIEAVRPNLILALGNTACWALTQTTKISSLRGTVLNTDLGKILPTYHPAAILRNYELRAIMIMDLLKAKKEMEYQDIRVKRRQIWVEPEIPDLYRWWELHGSRSDLLSVDIETERYKQISEIGMASDSEHALHIPFIVNRTKSYWPTVADEVKAWKFVHMVMTSNVPKLGQNFLYDFQYLWKKIGIPVRNFKHDTMLLHHALYPGMQKSLGFLGSIYCNERSWKDLRKQGNKDDE